MAKFFLENNTLSRLPIALSGITAFNFDEKAQVCPKSNIFMKRNAISLP